MTQRLVAVKQCIFQGEQGFPREKRGTHEKALKIISENGSKKTQVMTVLAHHLFSQLVPGKIYEVDNHAKQVPKNCSCGCKATICEGNTSVGSLGTWHGRADILLNHTISVAIMEEKMVDQVQEEEDSDGDEYEPKSKQIKLESENGDENECEPGRKQRCDIPVEMTDYSKEHDIVLLGQTALQQILAQTITNGFAQVNIRGNSLSHFLIPTFGATSEYITICLYDPVNDFLLHISEQLSLWRYFPTGESEINVDTIVIVWLFLNFTVFTCKSLHSFIGLKKSGLHRDLKQRLGVYKKARTREDVNIPIIHAFSGIDFVVLS
ncbi:uncharacterized protein LOC117318578 isoform X2 [Pecten maximus]|uniref:uncharacterized protein LOC117318578 isoform X2 n=1 Tax=Pecten maximus TaxID=6579 RepID=UPI00145858B1|nr:uncharacterized protein LOC117318578 isoform X2 [Pecten maximus]